MNLIKEEPKIINKTHGYPYNSMHCINTNQDIIITDWFSIVSHILSEYIRFERLSSAVWAWKRMWYKQLFHYCKYKTEGIEINLILVLQHHI